MSDMKCPFCQQELVYLADNFYCPNCYSNKHKHYAASPELWQELIRTRKALDVAVDALNKIYNAQGRCWGATDTDIKFDCKHYADEALQQIKTALEQKDVK